MCSHVVLHCDLHLININYTVRLVTLICMQLLINNYPINSQIVSNYWPNFVLLYTKPLSNHIPKCSLYRLRSSTVCLHNNNNFMVKIPMVCRQHVPTAKKYIILHTVLLIHYTHVHTTTYLHKLLNYTYLLQVIQD